MTTGTTTKDERLEVRVRMYTQGLGDCFLLTFRRGREKFNMLIDCGLIQGTDNAEGLMRAVVQNIKEETGGGADRGRLDLVVATHEHWDHISGFAQARDDFDEIDFDAIWLGWTEDKNDRRASDLKRRQEERRKALKKSKAAKKSNRLNSMFERIEKLLDFEGPDDDDGGGLLGAGVRVSGKQKAWNYLLTEKEAERSFCRPGQLLDLKGFGGVRIYVLGPPEDETLLRRSDPHKGTDEVYEQSFALTLEELFFSAFSTDPARSPRPFENHIGILREDAEKNAPKYEFFTDNYGFAQGGAQEWRRIDDDWLSFAGELALNLDSDTNNTCLALAIELVESGQVLLFPGDAQVGNWLSWQGLSWKVRGAGGRSHIVTAEDLLGRTVLYKVGHHGSYNATLKARGLELMTSPDLVALLPVDEHMARVGKGWKHMPLDSLVKRLKEKTRGRVLRADMDKHNGVRQMKDAAADFITATDWKRFEKRIELGENYIDYTISE